MPRTEFTLFTHPSYYINEYYADLPHAYDRVAGISAFGQQLWTRRRLLPAENDYRPTDTEATNYVLPTALAAALAGYFNDFYADRQRQYQISQPMKRLEEESNCHRFGTSLYFGKPQTFFNAYSLAVSLFRQRPPLSAGQLQTGELTIIGTSGETTFGLTGGYAEHTMVSLGQAAPDKYIQAIALAGNLGVSALGPMLDVYRGLGLDVETHRSIKGIHMPPDARLTETLTKVLQRPHIY